MILHFDVPTEAYNHGCKERQAANMIQDGKNISHSQSGCFPYITCILSAYFIDGPRG